MNRRDCARCGPGVPHDAARSTGNVPVWVCRNCGAEQPRRTRISKRRATALRLIAALTKLENA